MKNPLPVDTPENVTLTYKGAGLGLRFLAFLLDDAIITLLTVAIGLLLSSKDTLSWNNVAFLFTTFVIHWGYFIFFDVWWNGQSPGKRLLHLRVVRTNGTAIRPVDSFIRNLLRIVDYLPQYYFVGLVTALLTQRSQRLGDLAAGTLVIREQTDVTLDSLVETT
jgi:uncharacterized RDD family membrane protein YckC